LIKIYPERDRLLSEQGYKLVTQFYLRDGETSPQHAYARASYYAARGDIALAQRIYNYVSQQWFMFASPILSNARFDEQKKRGLPISCFLTYIGDNLPSIVAHQEELAWLTLEGGGVGGHWSDVRAVSKKAPGPIPFMKLPDSAMLAYKQGETRKGAYAAYLDIRHPDIAKFIEIRTPTGGDINRKCLNIHNAVNITNDFMEAVDEGADWDLVCPASGEVRETLKARSIWERLLETRAETGEPYLNFIDTAEEAMNPILKEKGLSLHGSNLCNEIHLPTDEERTAVCCLSSVNLERFDEWKDDPQFIPDLITMLDNVLDIFIEEANPKYLSKAIFSATQSRDIGLGAMGFHGLLQEKNIPFESEEARALNINIFSHMWSQAKDQTKKLAEERGAAPDLEGSMMARNAHLFAIAPNANSSIIAGCSPSIEPIKSNGFAHNTRAGTHYIGSKRFKKVLEGYGKDTEEIWSSIKANGGSVQHLEFLSDLEKKVFKTAFEIDQHYVVTHASDRQPFICQGQSVNLFFPSGSSKCYVNSVHLSAWKKKLKGLYYYRTDSVGKADQVGTKVDRVKLQAEECTACHA